MGGCVHRPPWGWVEQPLAGPLLGPGSLMRSYMGQGCPGLESICSGASHRHDSLAILQSQGSS